MAELAILAVLMAALAAVSVAQGDADAQRFRDAQCWREVRESPLDACRQVLERQLAGGKRAFPLLGSTGMRMRCCQQLQDVSRECRCAAVRRMVRRYEEQAMAPLEEAYPGEAAEEQQRDPWFYGETEQAAGGEYYGEAERQQEGEGYYYGYGVGRRGFVGFPPGLGGEQQRIARVKLTKVRQYGARLPTMCRIEPQECSVFSAGQY